MDWLPPERPNTPWLLPENHSPTLDETSIRALQTMMNTATNILDVARRAIAPIMNDFYAEPNPVDVAFEGLKDAKREIDNFDGADPHACINIALLGPPGSGKTSLVLSLSGNQSESPPTVIPTLWRYDNSLERAEIDIPPKLNRLLRQWQALAPLKDPFKESDAIHLLHNC